MAGPPLRVGKGEDLWRLRRDFKIDPTPRSDWLGALFPTRTCEENLGPPTLPSQPLQEKRKGGPATWQELTSDKFDPFVNAVI